MKGSVTNSKEDNLQKIKPIIDELKREEVQAIYLFGSHAKGNARPTSDIDICVIANKNVTKSVKGEIMANSSRSIDISIFWDLPPVIRFRVFRDGKPLYAKDELSLQRLKVDTLKSYLDIQPMIKRHCTHVLKVNKNV
jgi:Predicted nucleotidyltransferases